MLRFRLFGIPVQVAPYFWLGALLLGGLNQGTGSFALLKSAIWVACVFVSIIVHELGHALVGRRFGAQPSILLHSIGGLTFLPGAWLTRGRSILVSLAGPAFGFGLWGLTQVAIALLHRRLADWSEVAAIATASALIFLSYINLVWTAFNLLPILPLDGGQVFREALGPRRLQITRLVGAILAASVCVWMLLRGQIFIAFFMGYLAYTNYQGEARNIPGGVEKG